jgi:hypothetical protein
MKAKMILLATSVSQLRLGWQEAITPHNWLSVKITKND